MLTYQQKTIVLIKITFLSNHKIFIHETLFLFSNLAPPVTWRPRRLPRSPMPGTGTVWPTSAAAAVDKTCSIGYWYMKTTTTALHIISSRPTGIRDANNESSEVIDILLPVTFYFNPSTRLDNVKNLWRFVISIRDCNCRRL